MALSSEEFEQITQIVNRANESQFDRLSEKLELTVAPVKETLMTHIAHDEKTDTDMYGKLNDLTVGQTTLKMQNRIGAVLGVALLGVCTSVIAAVIKGHL